MSSEKTLSEIIFEELSKDITEQRLSCGQPLTLKMLKERFQISHTPIREALSRLHADGLVEYTANKGMRVVEFTDNDIKQLFELSAELEAIAVRFCGTSFLRAPMLDELEKSIAAEEQALATNDYDLWRESAGKIHDIFYKFCGNQYLQDAANKLGARMNILNNFYSKPETASAIFIRHKAVYDAILDNNYDKAADLVREHLQYSMLDTLENHHRSTVSGD